MHGPFETLLIANRGEIAVRVIHAAQALGLRTVAVYGTADRGALHVALADEAVFIGDEADGVPYLQIDRILDAATRTGAEAVHPGYGFLAERADFARAVIDAGLVWVGPPPLAMTAMAEKDTAKARAAAIGVAVVPGMEARDLSLAELQQGAARIGYPLLIKAVSGGGGRGMRVVYEADDLEPMVALARQEAANAFGDDTLLLERFIANGRHIEVQVLCDHHGAAVHLFERECSVQRRHQKLIEESPAPGLPADARQAMCDDAVRLLRAIGYAGAGTVEFLLDVETGERFFLEVNARIQVEHPVTEQVTGVDLVQAQLRVAAGEPLWLNQDDVHQTGHAMEVRLCAEDPREDHQPQAGAVLAWRAPPGVRVDTALLATDHVSVHYDSMVAKLIAHGPDRPTTLRRLRRALDGTELTGVRSNRAFLSAVLDHAVFRAGEATTGFLGRFDVAAPQDPIDDGWLVAAALLRHGERLKDRFRSNAWRADVTVLSQSSGERAHVYLAHQAQERWRFAVDRHPDDALMTPVAPTGRLSRLAAGDGWLRLEVNGRVTTYRVRDTGAAPAMDGALPGGPGLWIQRPGHDTEALVEGTLLPEPTAEALPAGSVVAPSAAMVGAVHVAVGAVVAAGDDLVTVEAMKMLTVLRAPEAGAVTALHCAPGESVSAGQLLVSISA